jgi:hypothetical protein
LDLATAAAAQAEGSHIVIALNVSQLQIIKPAAASVAPNAAPCSGSASRRC